MRISPGIFNRMQIELAKLNRAERRVADVVLANPHAATGMSIGELASASEASEPTVLRLVRRLGCGGFSDFKLRLSQDLAVSEMFVFSESDAPPRAAAEVAERVYQSAAQALSHSFSQRDPEALQAAADAILASSRVFCFGIGGSSANLAIEATTRLFRYDVHATASSDHYHQRMIAGLCEPGDVILAFSVTGQPPALVESVEIARELGAVVIAVTRPTSRLARASTIVLPLDIPDHQRHFQIPHRSRYGQLFILDCLATLVATERLNSSADKLRGLRALLLKMNGPTDEQPIGD
ncbi:MurR/RpiR family transcriptional regulator [Chelatococcus sp. GCM10030263]|uniref:MurR/RpiR family transcriptional regulator n=1 Tax=Chelatococcus sp. GCM10030263 TaxID=3273387 RepID=UPI0036159F24